MGWSVSGIGRVAGGLVGEFAGSLAGVGWARVQEFGWGP